MDSYNAKDLSVLEGLNAVRKRPGMYIGTTDSRGLMHCLFEIIDNSVDEALAGFCSEITVTLHDDGSFEVVDNGRGIPVDVEKSTKLTGVELVMTKLHAGGKFGQGAYNKVGGLHGVGASVVNALSKKTIVTVKRNAKIYQMSFAKGKKLDKQLQIIGTTTKKDTGTAIQFWPDPEIFSESAHLLPDLLVERLQQTAYLVPKLRLTIEDRRVQSPEPIVQHEANQDNQAADPASPESVLFDNYDSDDVMSGSGIRRSDAPAEGSNTVDISVELITNSQSPITNLSQTFYSEAGLPDFVQSISLGQPINPPWLIHGQGSYQETVQTLQADQNLKAESVDRVVDVDICFQFTDSYETTVKSFVNIISTPFGGTHSQGFEQAFLKVFRKVITQNARKFKLGKVNDKIEKEDIFAGLFAIVSVSLPEPQFEGQTKETLGTPEVKAIVSDLVIQQLTNMLTSGKRDYKPYSTPILEKVVSEMKARLSAKAHKELMRNKNKLESSSLPSKLVECSSNDASITELFIVEGDSALGTAKLARDSEFQALLPIRGKILNVQKASLAAMLGNQECSSIIQAIGAGSGRTFDLSAARYQKIIIMTDADTDGAHIRILLLTLFHKYLTPLIAQGRIYAAVPPLHRIELTKSQLVYTYSEAELKAKLSDYKRRNVSFKDDIQRYKGLGEMDAEQLADTTMDPKFRTLRRIQPQDAARASQIFELLMGDEVPPRRKFIIEQSAHIDTSLIDA
ncbi:MAG: type IIA DNA topoisomerase subunit B [Bifidobacteriaceae bacterium]|nr:type IIA DNA topoisomerase subunit B [Bifidobacteriaceae bacterium]